MTEDQSRELVDFARGTGIFQVLDALNDWKARHGNRDQAIGRFGIGGYHDLLSPPQVREAMAKEIDNPTIYPHVKGWKYVREAVAGRFSRACKVEVDPSTEVCLGCGGREVLFVLLRTLLKRAKGRKKGARKVIVSDPCYGGQYHAIVEAGGIPICIPCGFDTDYYAAAIEQLVQDGEEIVAVFIDEIHNPTGFRPTRKQMEALSQAAEAASAVIIGDEVYRELVHKGEPVESILQLVPHKEVEVVAIISGSKLYAMSRDRIGALVGHHEIMKDFVDERAKINYGPPSIIEAGYAAALNSCDDDIVEMAARMGRRATLTFNGFRSAGWANFTPPPEDGIFQLSDIPEGYPDALTFCIKAAREEGLEIWPAPPFGHKGNKGLRQKVRIPYVEHENQLPEAFDAMKRFLERRA